MPEYIEKNCNATQAELEQELPAPRPKKGEKAKIMYIFLPYICCNMFLH